MITGHNIGARIVSEFPDARDSVAEVIETYGQDVVGPAMFSYVSVGFFHPVFDPAIRSNDVARIEKCYHFLEELLDSPDPDIVDAAVIRVVPWTEDSVARCSSPKSISGRNDGGLNETASAPGRRSPSLSRISRRSHVPDLLAGHRPGEGWPRIGLWSAGML